MFWCIRVVGTQLVFMCLLFMGWGVHVSVLHVNRSSGVLLVMWVGLNVSCSSCRLSWSRLFFMWPVLAWLLWIVFGLFRSWSHSYSSCVCYAWYVLFMCPCLMWLFFMWFFFKGILLILLLSIILLLCVSKINTFTHTRTRSLHIRQTHKTNTNTKQKTTP